LVNGGRISGANSNVLTIANLQLGDAASYQLLSSNSFGGPVASVAANLYVTAVPSFHTNGVGWQFVNAGGGGSFFSAPDVLSLTTAGDQRRAAWFKTPMSIEGFKASFVYQDTSIGGADGFALVLQNSAQGTNALGTGGGGLAYLGISPSVGLMFNIFGASGITFSTNGVAGPPYTPNGVVDLSSGDPIQVDLRYTGSTLLVTLSNLVTSGTFSTNLTVGSLPANVGTNVAYIGITAATGGLSANQQVSNFKYVPIPTLATQSGGGAVTLSWSAAVGGFGLQSNPNLATPSWSNVASPINQINGQNQVIVPPTNGAAFYRLVLPLP
jgi:hypothetical protein